jgi:hypothetical protein
MREYVIQIGGLPHTVQLDDDEAKRLGATPAESKAAPEPKDKARTPKNKAK